MIFNNTKILQKYIICLIKIFHLEVKNESARKLLDKISYKNVFDKIETNILNFFLFMSLLPNNWVGIGVTQRKVTNIWIGVIHCWNLIKILIIVNLVSRLAQHYNGNIPLFLKFSLLNRLIDNSLSNVWNTSWTKNQNKLNDFY